MGIVRFALKFPYTFYVLAALILFLGGSAITVMPEDIFPVIDIPVVSVIWQYTGLSVPEMEQRVSTYSQYVISTNVTGIKNIEAQTLNGISVQKIYFQPDVNLGLAISQVVAGTNAIRALLPAGIQPPIVVQYNASSVPVLQLSLESDPPQRAATLRLRILQLAPATRPGAGCDLPDTRRRQVPADHGRHRSGQASGEGAHPDGRGERGQCPEPHLAVRSRQDRRYAIHRADQCDASEHCRPQ